MLVLTRKPGERVLIGDDIVITVLDTRGDGIRIGFEAPSGVKIQRAEIVDAISAVNLEAAQAASDTAVIDATRAILSGSPPPEPTE